MARSPYTWRNKVCEFQTPHMIHMFQYIDVHTGVSIHIWLDTRETHARNTWPWTHDPVREDTLAEHWEYISRALPCPAGYRLHCVRVFHHHTDVYSPKNTSSWSLVTCSFKHVPQSIFSRSHCTHYDQHLPSAWLWPNIKGWRKKFQGFKV